MSSVYFPESTPVERQLAELVGEALGGSFDLANVTVAGRRVILRGTAPTYSAKARAEKSLREAGFLEIENGLRVMPGLPDVHHKLAP